MFMNHPAAVAVIAGMAGVALLAVSLRVATRRASRRLVVATSEMNRLAAERDRWRNLATAPLQGPARFDGTWLDVWPAPDFDRLRTKFAELAQQVESGGQP